MPKRKTSADITSAAFDAGWRDALAAYDHEAFGGFLRSVPKNSAGKRVQNNMLWKACEIGNVKAAETILTSFKCVEGTTSFFLACSDPAKRSNWSKIMAPYWAHENIMQVCLQLCCTKQDISDDVVLFLFDLTDKIKLKKFFDVIEASGIEKNNSPSDRKMRQLLGAINDKNHLDKGLRGIAKAKNSSRTRKI